MVPPPPSYAIDDVSGIELSARDVSQLDDIFFEASVSKTFASPEARRQFRHRWLGRYLHETGDLAFVLRAPTRDISGYVVGSVDDPAGCERFADVGYFQTIADLTPAYPAHLHINLAERCRGQGLGKRLIAAFVEAARGRGASGVHVVTGAASRNVAFYYANGFAALRTFDFNGGTSVCLGRKI